MRLDLASGRDSTNESFRNTLARSGGLLALGMAGDATTARQAFVEMTVARHPAFVCYSPRLGWPPRRAVSARPSLTGSAGNDRLSGPDNDSAVDKLNGGDGTDTCGPVGVPPDTRTSCES
jgi:hypothetical protein